MNIEELDSEEVYESIAEGVRRAFPDAGAVSQGVEDGVASALKDMGDGAIYRAFSEGVAAAIWRAMNNATDAPCADFYDAITNGVAKGIEEAAAKGYIGK